MASHSYIYVDIVERRGVTITKPKRGIVEMTSDFDVLKLRMMKGFLAGVWMRMC